MSPGSGTGDPGPLRVAVDVSSLSDGSAYRGIGRHVRSLLAALDARPGVEMLRVDEPARRWPRAPGDAAAAAAAACGAAVYWSPAQSPPKRCSIPWVQTLHDLTPLVFESRTLRRERRHWAKQGPVLAKAAAIVCPSQSSVRQGVELLGLDAAKFHVMPLGIDAEFRPLDVAPADPPYLLVVSAWGPHKGFADAMAVVGHLASAGYPHRLRIVGPGDAWTRKQLETDRAASPRPERVDLDGYVDDLVSVYNQASVVLCPSRAEGFGLPIAEAMACGTPVVSYDNTSLPEVVGGAGLLVPDGDVAAMTEAVREILDNPGQHRQLRAAGLARALEWSWDRAAAQMETVFRSVAPAQTVP